jgi:segregation and condensation protein B
VERIEKRRSVEALILASSEPVPGARLAELVPGASPAEIRALVDELNAEYAEQGRSFQIGSVAGGYQIRTLPEFADLVQRLQPGRPLRLSRAALETLAIVAYRQPVTRAEVEHVRGVDVGAVLKSLLERRLVRIAGHREVAGRPLLYGTSRRFLEVFGLEKLDDLPALREVEELAQEGVLGAPPDEGAADAEAPAPGAPAPEDEFDEAFEGAEPDEAFEGAEPGAKLH